MLTISDTQIEDALHSVFKMAQKGVVVLSPGKLMVDDGRFEANVPRDPELVNLIKNLSAHQKHIDNTMPVVANSMIFHCRVSLQNMKLQKVYRMHIISSTKILLAY